MRLRLAPAPPTDYLRLRRHFVAGHLSWVATHGDDIAVRLGDDPVQRGWVPGVVLMVGAVHAHAQRLGAAERYLSEGLALLADTPAAHDLGDPSRFELQLIDVLSLLGHSEAARARAEALTAPEHASEVRLAANRAAGMLAALAGDPGVARWRQDAAADLALRTPSGLAAAMVEADRALVLSLDDRIDEALLMAQATGSQLLESARAAGPTGRDAATTAAACCLGVGRAGLAHDRHAAFTVAGIGRDAARRSGRPTDLALLRLTEATLHRHLGDRSRADQAAHQARTAFAALGCRPGAALAAEEQSLIAASVGRAASAAALADWAAGELWAVGHSRAAARCSARAAVAGTAG